MFLEKVTRLQGRHSEFEPDKVQYFTPKFFDRLFLIRAYWNPNLGKAQALGALPAVTALKFTDLLVDLNPEALLTRLPTDPLIKSLLALKLEFHSLLVSSYCFILLSQFVKKLLDLYKDYDSTFYSPSEIFPFDFSFYICRKIAVLESGLSAPQNRQSPLEIKIRVVVC